MTSAKKHKKKEKKHGIQAKRRNARKTRRTANTRKWAPAGDSANNDYILLRVVDVPQIGRLARLSGFLIRMRKLGPVQWLLTLCELAMQGYVSLNDLGARLDRDGTPISRQALGQKMSPKALAFCQSVLEAVIAEKVQRVGLLPGTNHHFKRIIIQDSTVIRLPNWLWEEFSGVKNSQSTVCNARIQGVYDLISGRFLMFSIDPYSRNDLSAALDFPLKAGDLVLRDRGYFSPEIMRSQGQSRAESIMRYKHSTGIYDKETRKPIVLIDLLRKANWLDIDVLIGTKQMEQDNTLVPMRLVAVPTPEELANLRRMRAKKNNRGHNPSQELLELMSWTIFFTTLDRSSFSFQQIAALYSLRWRIENIFKTWKSHCSFDRIHHVGKQQLLILLTVRLIMITLLYHHAFIPLFNAMNKEERELSLMKFIRYAQHNLSVICRLLALESHTAQQLAPIRRYCCMDKRKRTSLFEQYLIINKELLNTDNA